MALTLTDLQKVICTVQPVSAMGNPAPVDGVPVWTSSDEGICTILTSEDGLTAEVITVGPIGSCQIKCEADADLGEGIVPISGLLDIEVVGSEAVTMGILAGTPVSK